MISLIVNADDLGINPERDRGIIEAFEKGIVTSSTMIANGLSFASAWQKAEAAGLPVGVHLNLSDGITLSGAIRGLTDQDNALPGKVALRQYLLGDDVDLAGIRRELSAQIEKVIATGVKPTHLDGHQHCHIYPCLLDIVIELGREYALHKIRSVFPADSGDPDLAENLADDVTLFRNLGREAQNKFKKVNIRTTRGLWGLPQLHSLDKANLCRVLEKLPDGCWELMCHPGYPYPQGRAFEGKQRLTEVQALCSLEARKVITQHRIELCNYGDLPCV